MLSSPCKKEQEKFQLYDNNKQNINNISEYLYNLNMLHLDLSNYKWMISIKELKRDRILKIWINP